MRKEIPVGNSTFSSLIAKNCYYVDKTAFIRPIVESGRTVQLITRPRRFGKTLFMSTLSAFLSLNPKNPDDVSLQEGLFRGLAVSQDTDFCRRYMGRVPLVYLSLKSVEGNRFEEALALLARLVANLARRFHHLTESPSLDAFEKETLETLCRLTRNDDKVVVEKSLEDLLTILAKHYGRPTMLLIDEYDVPLAKAAERGYYDEMCDFMRGFLDFLKPDNLPTLENGLSVLGKAILTGCLRVSRESIFTGLNNLSVNTVLSDDEPYSALIGFTEAETNAYLAYYGLEDRADDVRAWYDGYRFGSQEIYSPWEVLNFCSEALGSSDPKTFLPKRYWSGTSGNDVIDEFLGFLTSEDADRMQALIEGREIGIEVNETLSYADVAQHRSNDFWTLLLFTGYLTVAGPSENGGKRLRIPNQAIRETFRERILNRYDKRNPAFALHGTRFVEAALAGNAKEMADVLNPLLKSYVSVRDAATRSPAENYYHGFLSALCASAGIPAEDFRSNAEAGDGYADIVFRSGDGDQMGVLLEIKRIGREEDPLRAAENALRQIEEKRYGSVFESLGCTRYRAYGIAFQGKYVLVVGGELRPWAS